MMFLILFYALLLHGCLAVYSDYFPPPSQGATVVSSKQNQNITLSYKKTEICEPSYSGFIHLPASTLSDVEGPPEYEMNVFFWFFPARQSPKTAPLSIWIGGGPGEAAIAGAMTENGPCYVNKDGNSTTSNPFSRNNRVNMLYVDQPIGAGYSYSTLVNVTYNRLTSRVTPTDFSGGIPFTPNITVFPGTVSNPDLAFTANNSDIAAKAMWHFAQAWFDTFPHFRPDHNSISLWTNSYGGYFGTAIFRYWESQNKKIKSGQLQAHYLQLDTLGIENGCIDAVSQALSWPHYAYNNTYGLQMINKTVYDDLVQSITDPENGCIATIQKCRQLASIGDPQFYANNQSVNNFCALATEQCFSILELSSVYANRNVFDIAQVGPQSFPGYQHIAFFNQRWVQQGLGVPLNFTDNADLTGLYFLGDGDPFRQDQSNIEYLLQNKIQVALVYGDRDSRCNWIGVENVSLTVEYPDAHNFRSAGYANIQTNNSYTGGVVRQYDGFSFSRIFEAGHAVSSFQPETSFEIFNRVTFRHDIATGKEAAGYDQSSPSKSKGGLFSSSRFATRDKHHHSAPIAHYQSKGPLSSWSIKNILPPSPAPVCNLWVAPISCTEEQITAIENGNAVMHDFLVTSPAP